MQKNPLLDQVPPTKKARNRLRQQIREAIRENKLVPPMTFDELGRHTRRLFEQHAIDHRYTDFAMLLFNNETWRDKVAAIPYERRLLLLPKCLRFEETCPAEFDAVGLVCQRCRACPIGDLLNEAERLGYAGMVAEGSPVVMSLIETGKVDAIVGVSCLSVLERVFPYMEAGAVPGVAIPLLNEGCKNTHLDLDWLWDAIHMSAEETTRALDIEALRDTVKSWFTPEGLAAIMGPAGSETEDIARQWLLRAGKRWRPLLTVCAHQALQDDPNGPISDALKQVAVAVECFHKASLIHDDIEDNDDHRYGEETLHIAEGVPVAINAGDLLLGEGYRLIAEAPMPPRMAVAMLGVAAEGHRTLCLGQGAELNWARNPRPLQPFEVMDIFRQKTAPAFDVALSLGVLLAGHPTDLSKSMAQYCRHIGIAYQIQDDLDDFDDDAETGNLLDPRPSMLLALAHEKAGGQDKDGISALWCNQADGTPDRKKFEAIIRDLHIKEDTLDLLDAHKCEAVRTLCGIDNANLKSLLRRLISKIFNEIENMGCCHDHQAGHAAGDAKGSDAVA